VIKGGIKIWDFQQGIPTSLKKRVWGGKRRGNPGRFPVFCSLFKGQRRNLPGPLRWKETEGSKKGFAERKIEKEEENRERDFGLDEAQDQEEHEKQDSVVDRKA